MFVVNIRLGLALLFLLTLVGDLGSCLDRLLLLRLEWFICFFEVDQDGQDFLFFSLLGGCEGLHNVDWSCRWLCSLDLLV